MKTSTRRMRRAQRGIADRRFLIQIGAKLAGLTPESLTFEQQQSCIALALAS